LISSTLLERMFKSIINSKAGKSGLIYTATNFFNAALPFLLLPILTRQLSEAEYGITSMVMVVVSVIMPLLTVGVSGSISRAYYKDEISDFPQYVGNCLIIVAVGFVAFNVIFFSLGSFITRFTQIPNYWYFACTFIALETFIIDLNLITYRIKFEAEKFAVQKVLQTILSFGLTYYFVVGLALNWQGVILARLIVLSFFSIYSVLILFKNKLLNFKINKIYMKNALLFGVPLLPHLLAGFLINASDRFFITNIMSVSQTGEYSVAYQIGSVIDLISSSVNLAWAPWLFLKLKDFESNRAQIKKATSLGLLGIAAISILFILFVPIILELFVSKKFNISRPVINIVCIGFVLQGFYLLFVNYLFYNGNTKTISIVTISIAMLNLVLNYVMILKYGIVGGAISTAVCFFLKFVIIFLLSNNKYKLYFK
jgi:O-antigen/teichoic acid export membrane protein